jgi:hypothetical protein
MLPKPILAINGGTPVRSTPMPKRALIGESEKEAVIQVLDESIESGDAFRYSEKYEREYTSRFVDFMGGDGFADSVVDHFLDGRINPEPPNLIQL